MVIGYPLRLYHYTTQIGFLGILDTSKIWATQIQYLNDTKELQHAIDIAKTEINKVSSSSQLLTKRRARLLIDSFETISGVNYCVTSFSEEGDNLGQWRAYAGDCGLSIGFDPTYLESIEGFTLVKCIYNAEEQIKLMSDLIFDFVKSAQDKDWENKNKRNSSFPKAIHDFYELFLKLALKLKHHAFSDEKEWRLISETIWTENLLLRPGKSFLIPYVEVPLNDLKSGLGDVYVGPSPNAELSLMPVINKMISIGAGTGVSVSTIPYRHW